MEKLDFLRMNSQIMSHLGKEDLDHKTLSNTIYWHICNPHPMWWLELLSLNSKWTLKMKEMAKWGGFKEDARWVHWVKIEDTYGKTSYIENTKTQCKWVLSVKK
jgi:hypothetical protein